MRSDDASDSNRDKVKHGHRRPSAPNVGPLVLLVLLLMVVYILSYAPVVRLLNGPLSARTAQSLQYEADFGLPHRFADGTKYPFFQLADYVVDSSPLHRPLLGWADLWGVGDEFRAASAYRIGTHERMLGRSDDEAGQ